MSYSTFICLCVSVYYCNKSKRNNPSLISNNQKITSFLYSTKVNCFAHNIVPVLGLMSRMSSVHTPTSYFFCYVSILNYCSIQHECLNWTQPFGFCYHTVHACAFNVSRPPYLRPILCVI
jgi:hypothetical protein